MLSLQEIAEQIDTLATCPPDKTTQAWRHLRDQIDHLCENLGRAGVAEAQATLPILAEIITRLDQVIAAHAPHNHQE